MALLCFGTSFCSCHPLIKIFPVFALDPIRPYLDWALRGFLTSSPISDPFKFDLKWRPKCKIWLKCQFAIEPSSTKNLNAPLVALMCPLQIISSMTLNPYHWPFMVWTYAVSTTHPMSKITQSVISWKLLNQKTRCIKFTYLYIFLQILGSKFKIPIATEIVRTSRHL